MTTHYLITNAKQAIGVTATSEADAMDQARKMGISEIIVRVDVAMSKEEWDAATAPAMTEEQALTIAKANYATHTAADINHLFKGGPAFDAFAEFGYRHGWYRVGEYSFNVETLTGVSYDALQGGWAYL